MPGTESNGLRRTTQSGAEPFLLRYVAGDSLASGTFARTGTATYQQQLADTLIAYAAGGSLSAATIARASTSTFQGNA